MHFRTFGPFKLGNWSPDGVDDLYKQFKDAGLDQAIGIYLVASSVNGKLVPQYVGKTDKSFGKRFKTHFDKTVTKRTQELTEDAALFEQIFRLHKDLQIFLIAHTSPGGRLKTGSGSHSKAIDRLEFELIGTCLLQNRELLNLRRTANRELVVPGYLNSSPGERDLPARQLAKMLGTKG